MKISIITVSYNSIKTISDTINSVFGQTYNNIEYIIIDGGSTDGTFEYVNSYKNRIHKIISEPDNGIYDAMNKGISIATGDIIGILNSDDLFSSNSIISDVVSEFILDKDLDIVYGDLVYVSKNNTNKIIRTWISRSYFNNFFEYGNVPPHPSLFVKNHIYSEIGKFNLHFKLAADYEFMLRLFKLKTYKSRYVNKIFVKMRLGGATNKSVKNIFLGNIEILNAWRINNIKIPYLLFSIRVYKKLIQFL
jgi:glycosyltransferase involved in cell wall biosynthesis